MPFRYNIQIQKILLPLSSMNFYPKKSVKMQPNFFYNNKLYVRREKNYANQDKFTQPLVVMVETFRRSKDKHTDTQTKRHTNKQTQKYTNKRH